MSEGEKMASKEENQGRVHTTNIEYTNDKGREVLLCKKTELKAQYDSWTDSWTVGKPVSGKYGIAISVSGHR